MREDDSLIDGKEVARTYGVSLRSVIRWSEIGRIPKPVTRERKWVRWSKAQIQEHIRAIRDGERIEAMT